MFNSSGHVISILMLVSLRKVLHNNKEYLSKQNQGHPLTNFICYASVKFAGAKTFLILIIILFPSHISTLLLRSLHKGFTSKIFTGARYI